MLVALALSRGRATGDGEAGPGGAVQTCGMTRGLPSALLCAKGKFLGNICAMCDNMFLLPLLLAPVCAREIGRGCCMPATCALRCCSHHALIALAALDARAVAASCGAWVCDEARDELDAPSFPVVCAALAL